MTEINVRRVQIGRWKLSIRKSGKWLVLPRFARRNVGCFVIGGWFITFMRMGNLGEKK